MNFDRFETDKFDQENKMVTELERLGVVVEKESRQAGFYILTFPFDQALTTIRIGLNDQPTGADLIITNMTTLPDDEKGKGCGGRAIETLLRWAKANNLGDIRAVQVQDESESFWQKNGFVPVSEPNPTNDFVHTG